MQTERPSWYFAKPDAKCFEHFEQHGFAAVDDVLDDQVVDALREAIAIATKSRSAHRKGGVSYGLRNLLDQVPAVLELTTTPAIRALITPVLGPAAFAVKGTLFDKVAEANWKVPWHQDTAICVKERIETPGFDGWSVKDGVVNVLPPDAVLSGIMTLRLHLDDCGAENGALRVLPGSHVGRLTPEAIEARRQDHPEVTCAVRRGAGLLMRPLTLHASSPALRPERRRVIHLEFSAAALPNGLQWAVNSCPSPVPAAC
jgi:hypothetical protein